MPSFICGSTRVASSRRPPPTTTWRQRRPRRVLLLGIGGAGKSTLFRQMRGPPVSYKDLQSLKATIHNLVVAAIKALVDGAATFARTHPSLETALPRGDDCLERSVQFVVEDLQYDRELLPKAARHIGRLWAQPAIQRTFHLRYHFGLHVPDSAPYFLQRINAVTALGYVPNAADFMHCTVKSSGITDTITDDGLQLLDLGGRRTERAKWARCFDAVAGVLFVASVGDFLDPIEEDPSVNRLAESVAVFEEIVNHRLCQGLPVVVVFTKIDILPETLRHSRLSDLYPDYNGGSDPQKAMSFFKALFLSKIRCPPGSTRQITFQACNALDRASAVTVLRQVRETLHHRDATATAQRYKF